MNDSEILQKAIQKAKENGWVDAQYITVTADPDSFNPFYGDDGDVPREVIIRGIVFTHDFAKAFWGEDKGLRCDFGDCPRKDNCECAWSWKDYLQQMVLEEKPIQYLAKFL